MAGVLAATMDHEVTFGMEANTGRLTQPGSVMISHVHFTSLTAGLGSSFQEGFKSPFRALPLTAESSL